jgi:nicotinamide-nucleotide amidase
METDLDSLALTLLIALEGHTVATAESFTGGAIGATITAIPGASNYYRGGIVAYASDLKSELLEVPQTLLAQGGAVQADVALAMAAGVAKKLDAEFGLAVTGVAGPNWQDGQAPGTVFVACVQRDQSGAIIDSAVEELHISPIVEDPRALRDEIRQETVAAALELLLTFL